MDLEVNENIINNRRENAQSNGINKNKNGLALSSQLSFGTFFNKSVGN